MAHSWTSLRPSPPRILASLGAVLLLVLLALPDPSLRESPDIAAAIASWYGEESPWSDPDHWTVVADIETPWGRETRIRPACGTLEVRGADLRIVSTRDSSPSGLLSPALGLSPLFSPRRTAKRPEPRLLPDGRRSVAVEALLTPALWTELRDWTLARSEGAQRTPFAAKDVFVSIRNGVAEFRASGTLLPGEASTSGLSAVARDCAIEIEMTFDPETGAIIDTRDSRLHAVGTAQVFDPNPIASSGRLDLRDGDRTAKFRVRVDLPRLDGDGRLRGDYVEVNSDREPRANAPDLVFDYLPYDPRFEEAMAYYHGDRSLASVEEHGFRGVFPQPLKIRVHGTALDNSWYSRRTREIVFGDGGVDDAEDADIIIHESGHAIHDALTPGFEGADMFAISEGFSDFWAASLTGDACVGDWDATSYSPPCLRSTDNSAIYPQDISASPHRNGLIFSGLFWDLRATLGARDTERLALATLLELGARGEWPEVGPSVLRAASRLELDVEPVSRILVGRGLLQQTLTTEIAPGAPLLLDLVVPALCLGERVTTLTLGQDGSLEWSGPGSTEEGAGPRVEVVPVGPAKHETPLSVRIVAGSTGVRIIQSWLDVSGQWMRVQTDWDGATGAVTWTYLQLPEDASNMAVRIGQSRTPSFPTSVDLSDSWTRVSAAGGLNGILGAAPLRLVGSRFEARTESGETWLERLTPLRSSAWSSLQLSVLPNPVSVQSEIRLYLDEPGPVRISIFSADGRRLRRVATVDRFPAGLSRIPLPLLDGDGRSLAFGHYWVRAESGGRTATTSFVRRP